MCGQLEAIQIRGHVIKVTRHTVDGSVFMLPSSVSWTVCRSSECTLDNAGRAHLNMVTTDRKTRRSSGELRFSVYVRNMTSCSGVNRFGFAFANTVNARRVLALLTCL